MCIRGSMKKDKCKKIQGAGFFVVSLCLMINGVMTGCTRMPDHVENPRAIAKAEIKDNQVKYSVLVIGDVTNGNSDVILENIRGEMLLGDSAYHASHPFKIDRILPFQSGTVSMTLEGNEKEMKPVLDFLQVGVDKLLEEASGKKTGASEMVNIKSESITMRIISCDKKDIETIFKEKGKTDEKNK